MFSLIIFGTVKLLVTTFDTHKISTIAVLKSGQFSTCLTGSDKNCQKSLVFFGETVQILSLLASCQWLIAVCIPAPSIGPSLQFQPSFA